MPANLTPDYLKAEEEFKKARTLQEKLAALKRMLSTVPKHKGTDKLQADIKRRIARLKEDIQQQGKRKGYAVYVEKEGAAQVAVVGPPNSGKSQLVATLTNVEVEVADYPFTTQKPFPAMMPYEDIQIQLVDLPPVSTMHMEFWVPNIVRNADAALFVVDLSASEILEQIEETTFLLEKNKVRLVGYDTESDPWASILEKKTWLVGTKLDLSDGAYNWEVVKELYFGKFGLSAVSAKSTENIERLRVEIFEMLHILRVYSKRPHNEADMTKPFVLKRGSTLLDFANQVHHDFSEQLKFARIWGHGKFDGQRVNKNYVLNDRDVIELHL